MQSRLPQAVWPITAHQHGHTVKPGVREGSRRPSGPTALHAVSTVGSRHRCVRHRRSRALRIPETEPVSRRPETGA